MHCEWPGRSGTRRYSKLSYALEAIVTYRLDVVVFDGLLCQCEREDNLDTCAGLVAVSEE